MNIEERATPMRVHMGRKYVAELNPNGSVSGNESLEAPGVHIMAKFGLSIFLHGFD